MSLRDLIAKLFPEKPDLTLDQIREGMSRRRFLGMAGGAAVGVVVAPELFELLSPKGLIVLPGGVVPARAFIATEMGGNSLLTLSMITNEALRILSSQLSLYDGVGMDRAYDPVFARRGTDSVNIRLPLQSLTH